MIDLQQQIQTITNSTNKYVFGFLSFGNNGITWENKTVGDEDMILIQWDGYMKRWETIFIYDDVPLVTNIKESEILGILLNMKTKFGHKMKRVVHIELKDKTKKTPKSLIQLKKDFIGTIEK